MSCCLRQGQLSAAKQKTGPVLAQMLSLIGGSGKGFETRSPGLSCKWDTTKNRHFSLIDKGLACVLRSVSGLCVRLWTGQGAANQVLRTTDGSGELRSKHVRVLKSVGLVRRRVVGRAHFCKIRPRSLAEASEWPRFCERFWNKNLDALEAALRSEVISKPDSNEKDNSQ
jgi:hypothetical protein